ncbi:MAG: ribosome-binding factor A [Acidimicrobiia bacterium]|nr:ribosome-binding factor A [Acidimicrobiia bacterium]
MAGRRKQTGRRPYDRTDRVGELIREVVADELRSIDDDRLIAVTITGAQVDPEIRRAVVYFDNGDAELASDDDVVAVLEGRRVALQQELNRQTRLRRTPELVFRPDEGVRSGARIEAILADLRSESDAESDADLADPDLADPDLADPDDGR